MLRTPVRFFSASAAHLLKKPKPGVRPKMGELTIAIEGCGHGTLTRIYESVQKTAKKHKITIDLLIICGDFQAVRNIHDLPCMSVPPKYRALADFHRYYSGEIVAPIPTLFIGGNHEASNHLWELYYGGWVAKKIYYLGCGGVVNFGGLRIAGLSGIYHAPDYNKTHYERVPYDQRMLRSIYHVRAYDTFKLFQINEPVDIGLSHDWPDGITNHGNLQELLHEKPYFKADIEKGELGSPPAMTLMKKWKPTYWFSAHMHCKFPAVVVHNADEIIERAQGKEVKNEAEIELDLEEATTPPPMAPGNADEIDLDLDKESVDTKEAEAKNNADEIELDLDDASADTKEVKKSTNKDEIDLDLDENDSNIQAAPAPKAQKEKQKAPIKVKKTRFLALDKCLPGRDFLQIMKIKPEKPGPKHFRYDREWLAITRALNPILEKSQYTPEDLAEAVKRIPEEMKAVREIFPSDAKLNIPENFRRVAPVQEKATMGNIWQNVQSPEYHNPQTKEFCEKLGIFDVTYSTEEQKQERIERFQAYEANQDGGGGRGGGGWRGGRGGNRGGGGNRGRGGRGGGGKRY